MIARDSVKHTAHTRFIKLSDEYIIVFIEKKILH